MKEDKIIELFFAENDVLKEKIEILENELKVSKAVATKFEEECKSLDEKIEELNLTKEFFKLEYDSQFKANKNLLAEIERLKAEIKKHKSKTAQEFVIRLLKKSLDAIPLADIYTTLEEMEGDE